MVDMTTLRKAARGAPCMLRLPGIHEPDPGNETSVLCHAPYPGRFGSRKLDWWGAIGCAKCHDAIDSRDAVSEDWIPYWYNGIRLTLLYFIDKKVIKVL